MEAETGVKISDEGKKFYMDNCCGPYIAKCSNTVPKVWKNKKKREQTRVESAERKRQKIEKERMELTASCLDLGSDLNEELADQQDDYDAPLPPSVTPVFT